MAFFDSQYYDVSPTKLKVFPPTPDTGDRVTIICGNMKT